MALEAVAALLIIVLVSALYMAVAAGGPPKTAHGTSYAGKGELVLEILNETDAAIQANHSEASYNVRTLYSNDSRIKEGADYYLGIIESKADSFCSMGVAPKELTDGTIVGIDRYENVTYDGPGWYDFHALYGFDGSTIVVPVQADPGDKNARDDAWEQKIKILSPCGSAYLNILTLPISRANGRAGGGR